MDADLIIVVVTNRDELGEELRLHAESIGVRFWRCSAVEKLAGRLDPVGTGVIVLDDPADGSAAAEQHSYLREQGYIFPRMLIVREAKLDRVVAAMRAGMFSVHILARHDPTFVPLLREALEQSQQIAANAQRWHETMLKLKGLADGELAVLRGMLEGKLNKRVANQLGISERTVEARRKRIFEKMDTKSVACLTRLIVETIGYENFLRICDSSPQQIPAPHFTTFHPGLVNQSHSSDALGSTNGGPVG
ncbi:response regulator transcription factor [Planctomycetaceae bacterium SH139]